MNRPSSARAVLASILLTCLIPAWALARTIQVGGGRQIQLPSEAARIAQDSDTIEIDAGEYRGDAAVWRADGLTLRGVRGMAHLYSAGAAAEGKAIWVIKGNDTTIENIGFHDAQVPARNGAGIRQEGRNLNVRHCLFKDNENGILAGANTDSEVLVEHSEFDHNGHGDGQSHNIYIGAIRRFTLRESYSHHARVGHLVKSRAAENLILNNRLADGSSGNSSYLIDLPSGGASEIRGNRIQQGAMAENATMVSYGAEKLLHEHNTLRVESNTFINERQAGCRLLFVNPDAEPAIVANNRFIGCARMDGPIKTQNNLFMERSALPASERESE